MPVQMNLAQAFNLEIINLICNTCAVSAINSHGVLL